MLLQLGNLITAAIQWQVYMLQWACVSIFKPRWPRRLLKWLGNQDKFMDPKDWGENRQNVVIIYVFVN